MHLSKANLDSIKTVLSNSLRKKFATYKPETTYMPFHTRILGKDRMALFSFIQSLNTNFGTSIFEPVSVNLALNRFKHAEKQKVAGDKISSDALIEIQNIIDELNVAKIKPNNDREIERIRKVCKSGEMRKAKTTKVDLMLIDHSNCVYFFDLKTAKPNKGNFKDFKRTLLEWAAVYLASDPDADIKVGIAIPYNPYFPKQYSRWTLAGMLDLDSQLKVDREFWDFLGGDGAFEDLLTCFEQVGIEMRDEIDKYFSNFNK